MMMHNRLLMMYCLTGEFHFVVSTTVFIQSLASLFWLFTYVTANFSIYFFLPNCNLSCFHFFLEVIPRCLLLKKYTSMGWHTIRIRLEHELGTDHTNVSSKSFPRDSQLT